jgi:hypothetical protein
MKIPCDKEVPVKKCTVEWVCPHCDCQGNCNGENVAPPTRVPAATPVAPAPPAAS